MKKLFLAILISLVMLSGCDVESFFDKAQDKSAAVQSQLGTAKTYTNTAPEIFNTAEPVIDALENATGKTIPKEFSSKAEVMLEKLNKGINKFQALTKTADALTGGASKPITAPVGTAAGILSTLIMTGLAFFERRRRKAEQQEKENAHAETKTMIKAVELSDTKDFGKTVKKVAAADGTAAGIEKKYLDIKAAS